MNQRKTTHQHRKKRNLRVFPTAIDNGFISGGRYGAGDEQDYNDTFERQGRCQVRVLGAINGLFHSAPGEEGPA